MKLSSKLHFLSVSLVSFFLSSSAFAMNEGEYFDWQKRPPAIVQAIDSSFQALEPKVRSSWNIYNGRASYDHLNISQLKLAKRIIEDAHKEGRTDVYILDSGAGDFQSCDAFANYIHDHRFVLPKGMTIHIIGTRGERYLGKEVEQIGNCRVYKFGSFKIEEHQQELRKRGLNLDKKIDLTISNWANRHYVDPLGTWMQLFETTRPKTGLLLMDWCYYLYEGEALENKVHAFSRSRDHLLDLLLNINASFLLHPTGDGWTRNLDRFLIRRDSGSPLRLPLAYKGVGSCSNIDFDIGSGSIVTFKVLDPAFNSKKRKDFLDKSLLDPENQQKWHFSLWGNAELFQWLEDNSLINIGWSNFNIRQCFNVLKDDMLVVPLYTPEEVKAKEKEEITKRDEENMMIDRVNGHKKKFLASLKSLLPPEIRPAAVGIANGARDIEHSLWDALTKGNFQEAQGLVDRGADVNRVFPHSAFSSRNTLLDHALALGQFPQGTIPFLLNNGARTDGASLDEALYSYKSSEDVKLLLAHGIEIKDVNLSLARSIARGEIDLIDLFISRGGNVNAYINCLPMIYEASYCDPNIWNYLIDRGAKGSLGNDLPKRAL